MTLRFTGFSWPGRIRMRDYAVAISLLLTIGGCASSSLLKPAGQACEVDTYAVAHPLPVPSGVPNDWDKSIPVPARATVAEVSDLQGSMRRVDFRTQGETYAGLKSFYTSELGAAGYNIDKSAEEPADKTIHMWFSGCGRHDTLVIFPDDNSPKDFDVRIVYATGASAAKTAASGSLKGAYEACAFGDQDACSQVESMDTQSGGVAVGAEHGAMIQEQLKSPEQRARDLGPFHGM